MNGTACLDDGLDRPSSLRGSEYHWVESQAKNGAIGLKYHELSGNKEPAGKDK